METNETGCTTCGAANTAAFTTKTYAISKVGNDVFLRINIERCCGCNDDVPECPDLDLSGLWIPDDCTPVDCLNNLPICEVPV
jgi:hypothetical protein